MVVEVAAVARNRLSSNVAPGVTLLELLLALALSVVVLSAIGMAINLYFKMLDVAARASKRFRSFTTSPSG